MRTLKLTLAYDGTNYSGWQFQEHSRSVQGELERTLLKVTGEVIRVAGSSRTDAGVHARGQVASFTTNSELTNETFFRALNSELPRDIAVHAVEDVPANFDATSDARGKRYRYFIDDARPADVFRRRYAWFIPTRLDDRAMHRAAQSLVGKHDFASFQAAGSPRQTTVRTLSEVAVERGREGSADALSIDVIGDGFLYKMVRSIVGTLVAVGRGKRPETWPTEVLAAADRRAAGQTAPAKGLFLLDVYYDEG